MQGTMPPPGPAPAGSGPPPEQPKGHPTPPHPKPTPAAQQQAAPTDKGKDKSKDDSASSGMAAIECFLQEGNAKAPVPPAANAKASDADAWVADAVHDIFALKPGKDEHGSADAVIAELEQVYKKRAAEDALATIQLLKRRERVWRDAYEHLNGDSDSAVALREQFPLSKNPVLLALHAFAAGKPKPTTPKAPSPTKIRNKLKLQHPIASSTMASDRNMSGDMGAILQKVAAFREMEPADVANPASGDEYVKALRAAVALTARDVDGGADADGVGVAVAMQRLRPGQRFTTERVCRELLSAAHSMEVTEAANLVTQPKAVELWPLVAKILEDLENDADFARTLVTAGGSVEDGGGNARDDVALHPLKRAIEVGLRRWSEDRAKEAGVAAQAAAASKSGAGKAKPKRQRRSATPVRA